MRVISIIVFVLVAANLFAQTARVKFIIGEARVKQVSRQGGWTELKLDTKLHEKDVIRTGEKSLCEIELLDGSVMKILENSIMELKDLKAADESGMEIFTGLGKFYFKIKSILAKSFKVSSPVAVAAIRGTEFLVVNQSNQTKVLVKTGQIDFSDLNRINIVTIRSAQKSSIRFRQAPEKPVPLTEDELRAIEKIASATKKEETKPQKEEESARIEPPPPTPVPETKDDTKEIKTDREHRTGFNTGIIIGAVTMDNKIYNQIGLRPEFSIGKLGVALDLRIYIDQDGNIRKSNWDSFQDIFEKIYYINWGHKGDPFYIKVGALDNYRLGFGLLMNHYSNTIEYPDVIRTGTEFGFQAGKVGFDAMLNNFGELLDGGGLMAGRISYRLLGNLEIGASIAYDRNQYKALSDRDGDGVPDYLDKFPDNKEYAVDSDNDGYADNEDFDRDGDGFTDNYDLLLDHYGPTGADSLYNDFDFDSTLLDPDPFNIKTAEDKSQIAVALDASYPLLNLDYLKLIAYGQYAKYPHNGAWGITAPGFLAKFAFINLFAEYRIFSKRFIPEYFNTTYELERSVFKKDSLGTNIEPWTKRQSMDDIQEQLNGYVIGADFNIFNYLIFGAEYQNMTGGGVRLCTFRSNLDLNTSYIPKIKRAGVYYIQNNAKKLFTKSTGTVLGYRLEYEISSGASLLFDFCQTYRDLNGDGKISGKGETVKTTNISTVLRF